MIEDNRQSEAAFTMMESFCLVSGTRLFIPIA